MVRHDERRPRNRDVLQPARLYAPPSAVEEGEQRLDELLECGIEAEVVRACGIAEARDRLPERGRIGKAEPGEPLVDDTEPARAAALVDRVVELAVEARERRLEAVDGPRHVGRAPDRSRGAPSFRADPPRVLL